VTAASELSLFAIPDIPLIQPGDDLARVLTDQLAAAGRQFEAGDVLVVAQKIVSKSDNRYARLDDVEPGSVARHYAELCQKDPRLVELILQESNDVVRHRPGVLIVEHRSGVVMANAGIDRSNIEHQDDGVERVLLLPVDSDASAAKLAQGIKDRTGVAPAVIISDSVGRAWRNGTAALALGAVGLPALTDLRGAPDLFGRPLKVSSVGVADQIASAAALLMGEGAEGLPAVILRGLKWDAHDSPAAALVRDPSMDLFR